MIVGSRALAGRSGQSDVEWQHSPRATILNGAANARLLAELDGCYQPDANFRAIALNGCSWSKAVAAPNWLNMPHTPRAPSFR